MAKQVEQGLTSEQEHALELLAQKGQGTPSELGLDVTVLAALVKARVANVSANYGRTVLVNERLVHPGEIYGITRTGARYLRGTGRGHALYQG